MNKGLVAGLVLTFRTRTDSNIVQKPLGRFVNY